MCHKGRASTKNCSIPAYSGKKQFQQSKNMIACFFSGYFKAMIKYKTQHSVYGRAGDNEGAREVMPPLSPPPPHTHTHTLSS